MNNVIRIPFMDLVTPHVESERELTSVFQDALRSARFIGGPMVEDFERDFARYCGSEHCVGVSNGTDALRFALLAAGIGPGEIVITVPNTFIATTEAVSQCGATPVFVDVDPKTHNIDVDKLREYLRMECTVERRTGKPVHMKSGKTVAAVVPVHLYGRMADMDAVMEIAREYDLIVVEDACQAHGAAYFSQERGKWMKAGTMGLAAAFSFYPGKNLGACGEAGAIVTDSAELAEKMAMLRNHGQIKKYYHEMEGYNGRLDAIQAGILKEKLKRLERWNEKRRELAANYNDLLGDIEGVVTPYNPPWSIPVYHLYVIETEKRDGLQQHLWELGIETGIHYPIPLHLQRAYVGNGYGRGMYPVAEQASTRILSLPMYPGLTLSQQEEIAEAITGFFKNRQQFQREQELEAVENS